MVSLNDIDQSLLQLEQAIQNDTYAKLIHRLEQAHPAYLRYITDNEDRVLTLVEEELLLFCGLAIWLAFEQSHASSTEEVQWQDLLDAEEGNWELWNAQSGAADFHDQLTPFFEESQQEELLAFIEDSLSEDTESTVQDVTAIGREPMFIVLKSGLDALEKTIAIER